MLCEPCQYVLGEIQKNPRGESTFRHHASIGDWERAVQQNCLLCRRLKHQESKVVAQKSLVADAYSRPNHENSPLFVIHTDDEYPHELDGMFCLRRIKAEEDRLTIPNYVPTNTVGSPQSMALARQWISECIEHHSSCQRTEVASKSVRAPDRLIYIDDENSRLRLIRGADVPSGISYTTLSHCWGQVKDKLVLTRSNIEEWHDQLPSLGKWKTFVDAVEISRQLQIPYIWIDSLCIIQDSKEDWEQQCPQMCNIYKRSYCNIAATSAIDDTEGCLFERDVNVDLPLRLCFAAEGHQPKAVESIVIAEIGIGEDSLLGQYDLCELHPWFREISCSRLNSRGWVLQERQLSPRILNFTKTQMYWECDEMQASESHPYGVLEEGTIVNLKSKSINPFRLASVNLEEEDVSVGTGTSPLVKRAFDIWAHIVSDYTIRNPDLGLSDGSPGFNKNLTNPADKLVAISAIAHELQPYMNCRYLAGHWETDLVRQLAWACFGGGERISTYRAPSWSWASVDAPIDVFHSLYNTGEEFHLLADVLNVEVELLTDDPMGQVTSGSLTLRCYLIELEVQGLMTSRYTKYLETDTIMVNGEQTWLGIQLDEKNSRPTFPWSVYCVPISLRIGRIMTSGYSQGQRILDFRSILLEKTEIEGIYQRVGFLGSQFAESISLEDYENDPLLRAIGSLDPGKEDDLFSPDTQGLQEIKIV